MKACQGLVTALLILLASSAAQAHALGASYLSIDASAREPGVTVQWEIAIGDLHALLDLDSNDDGAVTAGELQGERSRIARSVLPQLAVNRGARRCELQAHDQLVNERSDGYYALLNLEGHCPSAGRIGIDYRLLFDVDRSHRAVVRVRDGARIHAVVLSPDARRWRDAAGSGWRTFASFIRQGVHHIWIGYDHIAFLILLLLPAVLNARLGVWAGARSARDVLWRIMRIVTAFTAAHSITLSLAALEILVPPEQPVEMAIAASVVLAGLMNLVPRLAAHAVWIALGFGLIHGFGFASVLSGLGLQSGALGASLAGFNVGVEIGQLAIVAIALPLIYPLRATPFYRYRFVPAASLAGSVLALGWLLERAA